MADMTKMSTKTGLPPGTLVHIGEKRTGKIKVTAIQYNEELFQEREIDEFKECPVRDDSIVTWLNVDGVHQLPLIETVGGCFGLHPLTLEDIVNTGQFPKLEDYGDYLFIVLKMLYYDEKENEIEVEQVSLCLGSNFVVSFQEETGTDVFDPLRERLRSGKGRMRKTGADYLAYSLIDAIVDSYFVILEKLGESIEELEENVITNPGDETIRELHRFKREMIFLRKSVWPLREVIGSMQRGDSPFIHESMHIYLRDVYDHTIRIIETIETYRDILSGMLDIYLSSVSNRTNSVMKVLTIIATIFMPLTFLAGLYGMNFKYMPELDLRWAYPALLSVMAVVVIFMLVYFRVKKWL
jgi:magnesium transporter